MKKSVLIPSLLILCFLILFISVMVIFPGLSFFDQTRTAVSGIRIEEAKTRVDLPGKQLQCDETSESITQCQMDLEGNPLELLITYGDSSRTNLAKCDAAYAGASVECTAYFTLKQATPYVVIYNDLGISDGRFEALKRQNFILQFDETDWQQGITALGMTVAVATVIILWLGAGKWLKGILLRKQHPLYAWQKLLPVTCLLITGLVAFQISRFVLTTMLLLFHFVD